MKYLLTSVLTILGIFFIVIGLTAPSTLAVVSISQSTSQPNLSVTGTPYPSSSYSDSPTIFPSSTITTVHISFTTGYFTSDNIQIVSSIDHLYIDGSAVTPNVNVFINSEGLSGTNYYAIFVNMTYTYNNPIQGSSASHAFEWYASVTYKYTSGTYNGETEIASGTETYYGAFSQTTVYPGYFVMQFTYPNNMTMQYWAMNQSTNINLNLASSIALPITLTFIYVEYNASGNTMNGFVDAYITINSKYVPYNISKTNTTTYNGYNGLFINIKFNTGTYTIHGCILYNYWQNDNSSGSFEQPLIVISTNITITTNNLTTQSYYEIGIGSIFLIGAVFTGRRRL